MFTPTKLTSLSRNAYRWLAPEGFGAISGDVLLYAPGAIRIATLLFFIVGVVFSVPYMLEHWGDTRLVLIRLFVVALSGVGTAVTFIYVRRYYKRWVLLATLFGISSILIAVTYMDGLNVNPHAAIVIMYVIGAGFCLGRRGVAISLVWLVLNYLLLYILANSNVWPHPTTISVERVQHENASATFFLILILTPLLLGYLALVERSIKELRKSHAEQESLLQRLIAVQEGERARIAHLLHEGPVQDMAALRLAIRNEASESETISMVDTVLTQLRTLSSNLHPATLDLYGLPSALDQLAAQHGHDGAMHVEVSHPQFERVYPQVEIVLFRIAQEALNNVRKHSNAQHVWVRLEEGKDAISLEVRDDGLGFDVEPVQRQAVQSGHLGLATLHELALSVGGTLRIASRPGQGATVTVSVPNSPNPHPQPAIHSFQEQLSYQREENRSLT